MAHHQACLVMCFLLQNCVFLYSAINVHANILRTAECLVILIKKKCDHIQDTKSISDLKDHTEVRVYESDFGQFPWRTDKGGLEEDPHQTYGE